MISMAMSLAMFTPISHGYAAPLRPAQTAKDIMGGLVDSLSNDICSADSLALADSILSSSIGLKKSLGGNTIAQLSVRKNTDGSPQTFTSGGKTFKKYKLTLSADGFNFWRQQNLSTAGGKWSDLTLPQKKAALTTPVAHELIHACLQDEGEDDPFSCSHLFIDIAVAHTLCDVASEPDTTPEELKILCDG